MFSQVIQIANCGTMYNAELFELIVSTLILFVLNLIGMMFLISEQNLFLDNDDKIRFYNDQI